MNAADQNLILQNWLSPAFPVSAFSYSHGLETAIAEGSVATSQDVADWVKALITHGSARNDAILMALACGRDSWDDLSELALALANSAERLTETRDQGAAFVRTLKGSNGPDLPAMPYPVALGAACSCEGIDAGLALPMMLQAFAANLISVAVRLIPLGQTAGQMMLTNLRQTLQTTALECLSATEDDLGSATILSDMSAARHETLPTRIFRT